MKWGGAEILIQGQLISHPFPGGIFDKTISMTNSGILYRLDIDWIVVYFCVSFS